MPARVWALCSGMGEGVIQGTSIEALLLDLDGTLLQNDMDVFVQAYLQALGRFMSGRLPSERLVPVLLRATQIMAANDGGDRTNEEVFAEAFYPAVGVERAELEPVFMRFYAEEFPKLRPLTQPAPEAALLVEWAVERGLQVVIATNPLFPRTAIEQRLAWADVGVDRFPYALVTTYEEMHASKQSPAYYREIARRIGFPEGKCLMVGDNWDWDVESSTAAGLKAWWIAGAGDERPRSAEALIGQGTLADLRAFLLSAPRPLVLEHRDMESR